jgi:hypothetical protein
MIVYLWQAGTAEGMADTPWRARRRAADSMRRDHPLSRASSAGLMRGGTERR